MICEETGRQDDRKCSRAAEIINELIGMECQGFILPPSEVRRLLGIPGYYHTWYLHENIAQLREELENTLISMAVSPEYGISFTRSRPLRHCTVRVSPAY